MIKRVDNEGLVDLNVGFHISFAFISYSVYVRSTASILVKSCFRCSKKQYLNSSEKSWLNVVHVSAPIFITNTFTVKGKLHLSLSSIYAVQSDENTIKRTVFQSARYAPNAVRQVSISFDYITHIIAADPGV